MYPLTKYAIKRETVGGVERFYVEETVGGVAYRLTPSEEVTSILWHYEELLRLANLGFAVEDATNRENHTGLLDWLESIGAQTWRNKK